MKSEILSSEAVGGNQWHLDQQSEDVYLNYTSFDCGADTDEIGFLLQHGVSGQALAEARRRAYLWRVSPFEALLACGAIDEERLYAAVAEAVGMPFLRRNMRIGTGARFPECLTAGVVPLHPDEQGLRFAIAPGVRHLGRFMEQHARWHDAGVALTTPRLLTRLAMRAFPRHIAHLAANGLADAAAALSYRGQMSGPQIGLLALAVGVMSFFLVRAPAAAFGLFASLCGLVFIAMVTVRLACCLEPPRHPPRRSPEDHALPTYTVIVPLHREERVLPQLLTALEDLDYPPAKLDIKLVVESDDATTAVALRRQTLPPWFEVVVAPPGLPRTKPRALNLALQLARGEYTVVYDAEDVPEPQQLRLAAAHLAAAPAHVACLQAHLAIDNVDDSLLTRLFAIEYAVLFDVINPGLATFGFPVPLGGTSNHFRTAVLRRVHAWDAWNVTEDADLGLRLARLGYAVEDLPSTTREEAPARLRAWLAQRARWMKGWLQVCVTHTREPRTALRQLGPAGTLGAFATVAGTVLTALFFPIFLIASVRMLADGSLLAADEPVRRAVAAIGLTLFAAGGLAMLVPACIGLRRRKLQRLAPYVALMPLYFVLISFAAWLGAIELICSPFRWNKTEHGLARTSEAARRRTASAEAIIHPVRSNRRSP
ncbi:Glycosyltransferase, catalytic subunit of cellulose synthase and poly-beta-1,6-N-acetylglucosamine synthase [Chelatococcus sambhunathii]|uniref:Glycosyltransferase, catalytic subunit of cellulose synthase and poly-beta-1,6-N-acetylglucosamine synthase n=1 Tax=Chelatococcus sambhunathii TaxID=363953 RepID=A0ABP2A7C8_9HYPH|nr:Glycosyltransferase, catalytic subunit of cellulose synthase and poly-beta-1,6-N-acetylglucosamine synthase [Chelatococcus sambhunathii]